MRNLKITQTTALAALLMSLGAPAHANAAEAGQMTPQRQLDVEQVRRIIDQLVADLKTDAELAQQFEQNPLLVLSARGIPVAVQSEILGELNAGPQLGGGTTDRICLITCTFTCC